jgi:hypothetical protein
MCQLVGNSILAVVSRVSCPRIAVSIKYGNIIGVVLRATY